MADLIRETAMKPAFLLALLFAAMPPALADVSCKGSCLTLLEEGNALAGQDKFNEALAKYQAAADAAPQASVPVSSSASLLFDLSQRVKPDKADKAEELRNAARAAARRALAIDGADPLAQEILRMLDDDGPSPLHRPKPEAIAVGNEAENLFAQRRFPEALAKYEALMRLDPQYSPAWVGAGDCHYLQKDWAGAEALFRRATEIEPLNSQAWRFLSDALLQQGKRGQAEAALLSGIAADPSQRPNWGKLDAIRAGDGLPLKSLQLYRGTRVAIGADGKATVSVDDQLKDKLATPDGAVRLALAVSEANARVEAKGKRSAWDIELASWRSALQVADELRQNSGKPLTDPALLQIQKMAKEGQLEPAILLLQFRQAYRPALDAWIAAHPGGVKTFIDRYGVQP